MYSRNTVMGVSFTEVVKEREHREIGNTAAPVRSYMIVLLHFRGENTESS